jgi:hypothetical protein
MESLYFGWEKLAVFIFIDLCGPFARSLFSILHKLSKALLGGGRRNDVGVCATKNTKKNLFFNSKVISPISRAFFFSPVCEISSSSHHLKIGAVGLFCFVLSMPACGQP